MSRQGGQVTLGANSQRDGDPLIPLTAGKLAVSELRWHPPTILGVFSTGVVAVTTGQVPRIIDGDEAADQNYTIASEENGVPYDGSDIKMFLFLQLENAPSAADTVKLQIIAEINTHDGDNMNDEVTDLDTTVTLVVGSNDLNMLVDKLYRVEIVTISGKAGGKTLSYRFKHLNSSTHVGNLRLWGTEFERV